MAFAEIEVPALLYSGLRRALDDAFARQQHFDPSRIEDMVGRVSNLRMSVFALDHPPPHFHVKTTYGEARFSIVDCKRLRGDKGLAGDEKMIRRWWMENRCHLYRLWNELRPTEHPVKTLAMPDDCK